MVVKLGSRGKCGGVCGGEASARPMHARDLNVPAVQLASMI